MSIIKVKPLGDETPWSEIKGFSPTGMSWELNDISDSAAGRTMDGKMHKNMIAQKRTLSLTWAGTTPEETRRILKAFNPEYIRVRYPDALEEGDGEEGRVVKTFYTGGRSASVYRWAEKTYKGTKVEMKYYETISFNIIEV